ncbi:hypothetical protein TWF281_007566 [Arthrobotrys megalospora]
MPSISLPQYSPRPHSLLPDNEKGTDYSKIDYANEGLNDSICSRCKSRVTGYELAPVSKTLPFIGTLDLSLAHEPLRPGNRSIYEKYLKPVDIGRRTFAVTYITAVLWLSAYLLVPEKIPNPDAEMTVQPTWHARICKIESTE